MTVDSIHDFLHKTFSVLPQARGPLYLDKRCDTRILLNNPIYIDTWDRGGVIACLAKKFNVKTKYFKADDLNIKKIIHKWYIKERGQTRTTKERIIKRNIDIGIERPLMNVSGRRKADVTFVKVKIAKEKTASLIMGQVLEVNNLYRDLYIVSNSNEPEKTEEAYKKYTTSFNKLRSNINRLAKNN